MFENAPKYLTNLPKDVGNAYQVLSDNWGSRMRVSVIDQLILNVSISVGYEAQMRFLKGEIAGDPIPLSIGVSSWDSLAKYGFDGVEFKNADAGSNAELIAQVYGI